MISNNVVLENSISAKSVIQSKKFRKIMYFINTNADKSIAKTIIPKQEIK